MKHTPGPWVASSPGMDYLVTASDGRKFIIGDAVYHPENHANACLIAAAPDTFDELKRSTAILILLLDEINGTPLERLSGPVRQRIEANRTAMAKAEPK